jgi:hypothetical protein
MSDNWLTVFAVIVFIYEMHGVFKKVYRDLDPVCTDHDLFRRVCL